MASAASAAAAAAASAAAGVPWMEDVRVVARVAPSQRSTPPHSNDSSLEQISSPNNSSSPDNNQLQQHQQQQSTNLSGTFKAFPQQQPHDLSPENQTKVEDYYSPNFPTHKILQKKNQILARKMFLSIATLMRSPTPPFPLIRSSVLRTASPSVNGR